jgi:hypothetical protein
MTPTRSALSAGFLAASLFLGGCASDEGARLDALLQDEQQGMLDDLANGVPLLHQAGHDASTSEIVAYIEGPLLEYQRSRTYSTKVLATDHKDAATGRLTLTLVSYERHRLWDETIRWARACATVEIDNAAHTLEAEPRSCPAGLPASASRAPRLSLAEMNASVTPLVLAVTEAAGASSAATLAYILQDARRAGIQYGG